MVRPLNKRERETHRYEHPNPGGMRISIHLDRENQPDREMRERIVKVRALEATHTTVRF